MPLSHDCQVSYQLSFSVKEIKLTAAIWLKSMNSHLNASNKASYQGIKKNNRKSTWPPLFLMHCPSSSLAAGDSHVIFMFWFSLVSNHVLLSYWLCYFNALRSGLVQTSIFLLKWYLIKSQRTSFYKRDFFFFFCKPHISFWPCLITVSLWGTLKTIWNVIQWNKMQGSMAFRIIHACHPPGLQPNCSRRNLLHTLSKLTPQWILLEGNLNCNCTKKSGEKNSPVLLCNPKMFVKVHQKKKKSGDCLGEVQRHWVKFIAANKRNAH